MEWVGNTSYSGMIITGGTTEPVKTPVGILVTRAVETQDGWVGQVIVDKVIVWQSNPFVADPDDERAPSPETGAIRCANDRVIDRLRNLFAL